MAFSAAEGERGGGYGVEFGLEGGVAGFEVHDFLLEAYYRGPFLFEEARVFGGGGVVELSCGEEEFGAEGGGGGGEVGGCEVGDYGFVAVGGRGAVSDEWLRVGEWIGTGENGRLTYSSSAWRGARSWLILPVMYS